MTCNGAGARVCWFIARAAPKGITRSPRWGMSLSACKPTRPLATDGPMNQHIGMAVGDLLLSRRDLSLIASALNFAQVATSARSAGKVGLARRTNSRLTVDSKSLAHRCLRSDRAHWATGRFHHRRKTSGFQKSCGRSSFFMRASGQGARMASRSKPASAAGPWLRKQRSRSRAHYTQRGCVSLREKRDRGCTGKRPKAQSRHAAHNKFFIRLNSRAIVDILSHSRDGL